MQEGEHFAHEHVGEDGTIIVHAHGHTHLHTQTKQVLNRVNYAIGHMKGIYRMVEEGRDCSDVLLQLSAVDASLRKVKAMILKDHIEHCIVDAARQNDKEPLAKLSGALDTLIS